MTEKLDTLRTSMYLSNRQDPDLLRVMREIPQLERSKFLRDAANFYIKSQKTPPEPPEDTETPPLPIEPPKEPEPQPDSLDDLLKGLETFPDEL